MANYSVHVEIRRKPGDEYWAVSDDAVAELLDRLAEWGGVVSGGAGYDSWAATVTVEAPDAGDAALAGRDIVGNEGGAAGLPGGDVVRAEAVREDVLDEDNARPQMPDLVSAPEAAAILGVSEQRVHQLAKDGRLRPAIERPRATLWFRAGVERFAQVEREPGRPAGKPSAA